MALIFILTALIVPQFLLLVYCFSYHFFSIIFFFFCLSAVRHPPSAVRVRRPHPHFTESRPTVHSIGCLTRMAFFYFFLLSLFFISSYHYTLGNIILSSTFITKKPVSFLVIICIVALFICIPSNFPWSISLPSKNKMFALVLLDSIRDINTMINSCHQLHYIWQSKINIHILWE